MILNLFAIIMKLAIASFAYSNEIWVYTGEKKNQKQALRITMTRISLLPWRK